MNKFDDGKMTVTIRDLKKLGLEGGAFAYLESGEKVVLKPKYGTISKRAFIAGKMVIVDLIVEYKTIYSKIRLIDRNGILIAKKCHFGNRTELRLTGSGYHRKSKGKGNKHGRLERG